MHFSAPINARNWRKNKNQQYQWLATLTITVVLMFNHHYNRVKQAFYNCHQQQQQQKPTKQPFEHSANHHLSIQEIHLKQQTCWLMCLINKIVSFGLCLTFVYISYRLLSWKLTHMLIEVICLKSKDLSCFSLNELVVYKLKWFLVFSSSSSFFIRFTWITVTSHVNGIIEIRIDLESWQSFAYWKWQYVQ